MKSVKKDGKNDRLYLTVQVNSFNLQIMKTAIALKKYRFPGYPDEQTFFAAKAAAAICREGFGEFVIKAVLERTNAINQQYKPANGNQDPLEPCLHITDLQTTGGRA